MTKKYSQLNLEQRYKIEAFLKAGKSQTFIANYLGVNKSTISRELKRNVPKRGHGAKTYIANKAQSKTVQRHIQKHKRTKFTESMKQEMKVMLEQKKYSPELISASWRKENKEGVSHETIYKFIWDCKHSNRRENKPYKNGHKNLNHGRRRRKRGNYKNTRGLIPNRVSIEKRPKIVENESDLEM